MFIHFKCIRLWRRNPSAAPVPVEISARLARRGWQMRWHHLPRHAVRQGCVSGSSDNRHWDGIGRHVYRSTLPTSIHDQRRPDHNLRTFAAPFLSSRRIRRCVSSEPAQRQRAMLGGWGIVRGGIQSQRRHSQAARPDACGAVAPNRPADCTRRKRLIFHDRARR
jgi:hypothetical protein